VDTKKVIIFLFILVVYVNYTNYIQQNSAKLYAIIENLKVKIAQEKEIQKEHPKKEDLSIATEHLMFDGNKFNYSQAMGKLQEIITKSAKKTCSLKKIQWAQTASSTLWYDRLRMNLTLECTPKAFYTFTNKLKEDKKLFIINNFRVLKTRNKEKLYISMQLMAYRKNK